MFINIVINKQGGVVVMAGESNSQDLVFDPDCDLQEAATLVSQLFTCAQNPVDFHPSHLPGLHRWRAGSKPDYLHSNSSSL